MGHSGLLHRVVGILERPLWADEVPLSVEVTDDDDAALEGVDELAADVLHLRPSPGAAVEMLLWIVRGQVGVHDPHVHAGDADGRGEDPHRAATYVAEGNATGLG